MWYAKELEAWCPVCSERYLLWVGPKVGISYPLVFNLHHVCFSNETRTYNTAVRIGLDSNDRYYLTGGYFSHSSKGWGLSIIIGTYTGRISCS